MPLKTRQASPGSRHLRRKGHHNVVADQAHIESTFSNTVVSITSPNGTVIASCSSGQVGLKGSRKSAPYAAQLTAENATRAAVEHGMRRVDASVKGPDSGREMAIRSLTASDLEVTSVSDVTPQTYSGCRPPERRRM